MTEYVKTILQKVSFSNSLFEHELRKGIRAISPEEIHEFKDWCYISFGKIHSVILNRHFQPAF
jgi:hypothetical protein